MSIGTNKNLFNLSDFEKKMNNKIERTEFEEMQAKLEKFEEKFNKKNKEIEESFNKKIEEIVQKQRDIKNEFLSFKQGLEQKDKGNNEEIENLYQSIEENNILNILIGNLIENSLFMKKFTEIMRSEGKMFEKKQYELVQNCEASQKVETITNKESNVENEEGAMIEEINTFTEMKLPIYNGTNMPWTYFIRRFKDILNVQNPEWDDTRKKNCLVGCLDGNARDKWEELEEKEKATFEIAVKKLEEVFNDPNAKQLAKIRLATCKQGEDESVIKFTRRLEQIVKEVTMGLDTKIVQERLLDEFLDRLRPDIGFQVKLTNPKTYEDALIRSQHVETILIVNEVRKTTSMVNSLDLFDSKEKVNDLMDNLTGKLLNQAGCSNQNLYNEQAYKMKDEPRVAIRKDYNLKQENEMLKSQNKKLLMEKSKMESKIATLVEMNKELGVYEGSLLSNSHQNRDQINALQECKDFEIKNRATQILETWDLCEFWQSTL